MDQYRPSIEAKQGGAQACSRPSRANAATYANASSTINHKLFTVICRLKSENCGSRMLVTPGGTGKSKTLQHP